ncbi:D-glycero-alpha-D-manno-heptose-1,7-bisphosphate 7-phosphatase [Paenibacillus sp. MMS18-CY102]|uniref:D-glycero-alpha-D-manno-heptose-1,7-bisphosphate 7-phosphatase n=1 Tax=Paenibacillus sp. MMS18-CY102 TaxID=2682849 RepID=UPI0013661D09|nr:HAD family hydrolase [Paenibacillus sp. MMS18-CY102]MWC30136.1 HAD-IIIA family hydrolase [Paenibacillus sp. MMS18-CY102]
MTTVFLDRDGVINEKIENGYVTSWEEFAWMPGAIGGIKKLHERGWNIIVVTNQACVGKQLAEMHDIDEIHRHMQLELQAQGISLTQIYVCPHTPEANCACRKPRPGMLLQAAQDHNLQLQHCYFVGDSWTDMQAAQAVHCYGIFVQNSEAGNCDGENDHQVRARHVCATVDEAIDHIILQEGPV